MTDVVLSGGINNVNIPVACDQGHFCTAMLDTGTSLITAPAHVVEELHNQLKQLGPNCDRIDRMPNLKFRYNGAEISLPPESYIGKMFGKLPPHLQAYFPQVSLYENSKLGRGWKDDCSLLMMTVDLNQEGDLWIIGMPFFREYYTTFDMGDGYDKRGATMYVAKADNQCNHPSEKRFSVFADQRTGQSRSVDLSKVRLPPWVVRAHLMRELLEGPNDWHGMGGGRPRSTSSDHGLDSGASGRPMSTFGQ